MTIDQVRVEIKSVLTQISDVSKLIYNEILRTRLTDFLETELTELLTLEFELKQQLYSEFEADCNVSS